MTSTAATTTTTVPAPTSASKTDALADRMLGMFNDASLVLMMAVGHRTGLFDAMSTMPPADSAQIAQQAGLNERYVREWLGAMTTGGIVDYDPAARTFTLPADHAALLTRGATPNLAATCQWFSVLGSVEDRVLDAFKNGGGVHYCHFDRFHEVMASESEQTVIVALIDHILPLVPGLIDRLRAGIDVLDVGCGAGFAMVHLAEHFPNSRFTGYDLSSEATAAGMARARDKGLSNIQLLPRDVTDLGEAQAYDLITAFDAIHDQARPDVVLQQIHKALRDDGVFLMQDIRASSYLEKNIGQPLSTFFYTISTMHCMTVSLAQGGAGLGTVWGEELAVKMVGDAGFTQVSVHQLDHDIQNNYYVARK